MVVKTIAIPGIGEKTGPVNCELPTNLFVDG
jgi:hypothetical protein